jgi:alpha-glucosidase (family GH31 glycosyl hydrolase)
MTQDYLHLPFHPIADPAAVVSAGNVRFTVLTARMLRLEYSPTGAFENRPSQAFWYRRQLVPAFDVRREDGAIEIETEHLLLRYVEHEQGFTPISLSVTLKASGVTWCYGDRSWAAGNLQGTTRTLDEVDGWAHLEPGLMARNGYAVVDDSRSLVFDKTGWIAARAAPDNLDLYFFGYGHDYIGCLQEFQRVAGATPMIPRYLLGNWWSRFWAYDEAELKALMEEFRAREFPLAVCIVDMDWHTTQTGNRSVGWTGYTWNREIFPDPAGFIAWLHAQGLRTALNLHPADGVHPHEEQYADMAAAVGIDPATGEPVEFDSVDQRFVEAYFKFLHHPQEEMGERETEFLEEPRFLKDGVDFWWLDWQQGKQSKLQGLDPLWWLNHLHFYDLGRDGVKRPFIFSRWGGLGNHRYPIGFSGDTVVSWASLANQPYFTATAANVGYGWWSHDIGGHMWGVEDAELYLRWVQYGVLSPILRLHSTNNPYQDRRPWGWGAAVESPARAAMQLRHALIPYIYSMAWRNHTAGIPLVTPLYYSNPEDDDAYNCPQAYWFGSELIAAPFTAPTEADLGLSRQRVWLPDGLWFDFFIGRQYAGGWQTVYGDWSQIPVFAKAGAIIPLGPLVGWGGVENPTELTVHVFPGADGQFTLYEDDGETVGYQRGAYAETPFTQVWRGDSLTLAIGPVQGDVTFAPARRTYVVEIHAVAQADVTVTLDGKNTGVETAYDAETQTLAVTVTDARPNERVEVAVTAMSGALLATADRRAVEVRRLLHAFRLGSLIKWQIDSDLPQLLSGEATLARYALTPGQQQALHHALAGTEMAT